MDTFLKNAFDLTITEYNHTFKYLYPSLGNRGFTERNLTCRYCKHLEAIAKVHGYNVVTWYEFPLPDDNEHIDAVVFVFNEKENHVVLIESKRVTENSYIQKTNSIIADMNRMSVKKNIDAIIKPERFTNEQLTFDCFYTVLLADIWRTKDGAKIFLEQTWPKVIPEIRNGMLKTFYRRLRSKN
jgi:hypothetical protein